MKALFMVIERDDAVLIPDQEPIPADFRRVDVELAEGLTLDDINTDKVVLLEWPDGSRLRFERGSPDSWDADYDRWEAAGWMPIGFEAVTWYASFADCVKHLSY